MSIKGVDVYHGDGDINWQKVKAAGYEFAFIKCTEGLNPDPKFQTNWHNARIAGLLVGAYHFFHPAVDPVHAAQVFLNTMGPLSAGCLPPVLDWETHQLSISAELAAGISWLNTVHASVDRAPIIYAGQYYIGDLGNPEAIAQYPLWLADYRSTPHVPAPYKQYTFWQNTDKGVVDGIGNGVDISVFNGSQADLNALAGL